MDAAAGARRTVPRKTGRGQPLAAAEHPRPAVGGLGRRIERGSSARARSRVSNAAALDYAAAAAHTSLVGGIVRQSGRVDRTFAQLDTVKVHRESGELLRRGRISLYAGLNRPSPRVIA